MFLMWGRGRIDRAAAPHFINLTKGGVNVSQLLKKIVLNCMTIFVISAYLCLTFAWQADVAALNIEAAAAHVDIEVADLDQIEVNLEELKTEPYERNFTVQNKSTVPSAMIFQLSASNEAAQTLLENNEIEYEVLDELGGSLTTVELMPGMYALNLTLKITLSGEPDLSSDTADFLFQVTAQQIDNLATGRKAAVVFDVAPQIASGKKDSEFSQTDRDDIVISKDESENSSADADALHPPVEDQQSGDSDKDEGEEGSVHPPVSADTEDTSSAASDAGDGVISNE